MPKLSPEMGRKVSESDDGGNFGPLPEGRYTVKLVDVESTTSQKSGAPMWKWKFETVAPADHEGRTLYENTVIQDNALWKLNSVFAAFGVSADTDTDELVGRTIDVMVVQEIAQMGKLKGKPVSRIGEYIPATAAPKAAAGSETIPF